MLLFWVIISATDPVAVLAIFKHMWVPKRLRLLFEWESLFNDWTSIAVFLILLEIAQAPIITSGTLLQWLWTFLMMVIWWMLLWIGTWIIFSYIIKSIKNNEYAEITLIMVLAHITFFLAEYISHISHDRSIHIQLSWVIATAYAALIMGNFWKTKITPKVEEYMEKFRWFFSFVCNALVFLLMWLMIGNIAIPLWDIWPVLVTCIVIVTSKFKMSNIISDGIITSKSTTNSMTKSPLLSTRTYPNNDYYSNNVLSHCKMTYRQANHKENEYW